ncbi:MAG: UbiX family flavin prenyltransferase [Caldisphaera sp.]|jgi:4-hydroxy-3-polyprenylbenzoate decarboxylase|nr:UbiX family flavin prenyltransferase [Caldisphaera sp.]PMP60492.1 MAG: aromatic acid decarboxylase [Caldisphaera sp.]PMP90507.1 MAG: aromatic acid decarboxylase [Caldisphaera sp.]
MGCESIAIAITGASGIRYSIRILDAIKQTDVKIKGIIYSKSAIKVAQIEEKFSEEEFLNKLKKYGDTYSEDNYDSPLASSSSLPDCMVICPASMKTIGIIANGIPLNLISRAGLSFLRMKRPLVIAFREAPIGTAEISNLLKLSKYGAIIMPLAPGFYSEPKTIDDLIDFMVGKILDSLNIPNRLYKRWSLD